MIVPQTVCAVDPGSSGAAVLRWPDHPGVAAVVPYVDRRTPIDVARRMSLLPRPVVVIEKVWASPVMGPSGAFSFGGNFEGWITAFLCSGITPYLVTPQVWQKVAAPDVTSKAEARKRDLRDLASSIFDSPVGEPLLPRGVRVNLTNCDALLLSHYAVKQLAAGHELGERV